MKLFIFLFALLVVVAESRADTPSSYRYALLIGNSEYKDFCLSGAKESLDAVENTLKELDFRVVRHSNLEEEELDKALEAFAKSVPTNAVALNAVR